MKLTVGGFQCGIGNLLGFQQEGFQVNFNIDNREFIHKGKEAFIRNFPSIILSTNFEYGLGGFPTPTVLISSPSCSQISALGVKRKDRAGLKSMGIVDFEFYHALVKLLNTRTPYIVMEYLPALLKFFEVRHTELYCLSTKESYVYPDHYRVQIINVDSQIYGTPQSRKRLFIFFSLKELDFIYLKPSTMLAGRKAGEVLTVLDEYRKVNPLLDDEHPNHSEAREQRFSELKPGDSFYGTQNNKRLDPSRVCPVIASSKTQHVHPWHNRVLTPREAATFQGFPLDFEFGKMGFATKLDLIGRSIPVQVAQHIAAEIKFNYERNIDLGVIG